MFNEKRKRHLVKYQDTYTLKQFSEIYKVTPQEVYDEYERLFDTGEYHNYYQPYYEKKLEKLRRREYRMIRGDTDEHDET